MRRLGIAWGLGITLWAVAVGLTGCQQPASDAAPGEGTAEARPVAPAPEAAPGGLMDEPVLIGKSMDFAKGTERSDKMNWDREPMHTAAVPNRSKPARQCPFEEAAYDSKKKYPETSVAVFVKEMLDQVSIRHEPFGILYSMREMDYYANQKLIQAEFERQVAAQPAGDKQNHALENYGYIMLYMGEFEHIISHFVPWLGKLDKQVTYGALAFIISQSYWRLGKYEESLPYAKDAQDLLIDSPNDTRWHLMLVEMALYGADFYQKYSRDRMSLEHVPAWFPKAEWELPFEDVTAEVMPPDFEKWGGYGYTWLVDMDKDGWDDLFYQRKWYGATFYKNMGGTKFERIDETDNELGSGMPHGAQPGDIDNDGEIDWYETCCNYDGTAPLSLLKGLGDFKFEDVAKEAGIADAKVCGMAMLWIDYDLDSFLDIILTSWCGQTRIYRNNGDSTFTDVHDAAGFKTPGGPYGGRDGADFGSHGVTAGHFLNDNGYPDLYLQGWGWRQLYENNGDGTFTLKGGHGAPEGAATGVEGGENAKNYWAFTFDYNNDGRDDILSGSYVVGAEERFGISPRCTCSNILTPNGFSEPEVAAAPTVFSQTAPGKFVDIRDKTRIVPLGAMGYQHADWNNDGYEDMVFGLGGPYFQQAEPYLFYENNGGDGTFTNKTPFHMLSIWGKGHGLSFGDFNRDGHMDLAINNGGANPGDNWPGLLLRNTGENKNHFLEVELKAGKGSNSLAIGALITVKAGDLQQRRWLWSGSTFGQNTFRQHFGLARHTKIDELKVYWPNKKQTVTTLTDVAADQAIVIHQDSGKYDQLWSAPVK